MVDPTDPYPPIADYGLIGDMRSCALVSKAGSIDWCCLPRFDSPSVFGRLLDWERGGHFQIRVEGVREVRRRYVPETMVLETTFRSDTGEATLIDFMPLREDAELQASIETGSSPHIVRFLRCDAGSVQFSLRCQPRFDYGAITPRVSLRGEHVGVAHRGGYSIRLSCTAALSVSDDGFVAAGRLAFGERLCADLAYDVRLAAPEPDDAVGVDEALLDRWLKHTLVYWREWAAQCRYAGTDRSEVVRSALTLKALTYAPSGAMVAAATTSLPERTGGNLNWDYRFTWIRDATFALHALRTLGHTSETRAFDHWVQMSSGGQPRDLRLMYGVGGEHRLTEVELPGLEGYRGSKPVRTGNAAHTQLQMDIYGDLMESAFQHEKLTGELADEQWAFLRRVVAFVLDHWGDPDEGIWESRRGRAHQVHSKVMCWVALDRAIDLATRLALSAELGRWRAARETIRADVLQNGYDAARGSFVKVYGGPEVDASALLLPLVGFVAANDPRMRSTVATIERELMSTEGFVYRNAMHGPLGSEGTFAVCSFWLADNYVLQGELGKARRLFERVKGQANDLGLFSEEFDPKTGQLLGNFPQAFSHVGHIGSAVNLHLAASRGN